MARNEGPCSSRYSSPVRASGRNDTRETFTVKVSEGGYPTAETDMTEIHEVSAAEIDWASRHALGHAESVYRAVLDHVLTQHFCGTLKAIGPLRPLGPSGGVIGFAFAITAEIPWLS